MVVGFIFTIFDLKMFNEVSILYKSESKTDLGGGGGGGGVEGGR